MGRFVVRTGTLLGVIGLVVGLLVASPAAAARKVKPGQVTGLALSFWRPADHYVVTSHWDADPNATKYVVKMTDSSGLPISPGTTTQTTWSLDSYAAPGTTVTVTVTAYIGKVRGKATRTSALLPDLTAPIGAYRVVREVADPTSGNVTVQQDVLSDNLDPIADLTQTVDWGDGTPVESWSPLATTITHSYPGAEAVYYPVVSVSDIAGNTSTYQLVVAVADTLAPTGTFTTGPSTGYAGWNTISIVQDALSDDLSAADNIARVVDWGDGTAPELWTAGDTLDHVYAVGGDYTPKVTLTDEAGNSAVVDSSPVTVSIDTDAPKLRVAEPKRRHMVRAWRRVHGIAVDSGVGVAFARIKVIEKRHGDWFVYRFKAHAWKQVGPAKRAALHEARAKLLRINHLNHWSVKVRGLRKGVLVVRAISADHVGNADAKVVRQRLIRR
jgi:hypothetical protein